MPTVNPQTGDPGGPALNLKDAQIAKAAHRNPGKTNFGDVNKEVAKANAPPPETPTQQMQDALKSFFQPEQSQVSAAATDYGNVIGQIEQATPGAPTGEQGTYTGPGAAQVNAAAGTLNKDIAGYTNTLEGQTQGLQGAEAGIGKAITTAESGLPYADVLSTMLTANKNAILYGKPAQQQTVNTTNWPDALKGVVHYLQSGTGGLGTPAASGGVSGPDSIFNPAQAGGQTSTEPSNPSGVPGGPA